MPAREGETTKNNSQAKLCERELHSRCRIINHDDNRVYLPISAREGESSNSSSNKYNNQARDGPTHVDSSAQALTFYGGSYLYDNFDVGLKVDNMAFLH